MKSAKTILGQFNLLELLEIGFLTGSRAFGTATEDSDWDIVIQVQDRPIVDGILKGYEQVPSNYNSGFKVYLEFGVINIIPVHPHAFIPWYLTTVAMKNILQHFALNDPIKQHAVFGGLVCLLTSAIDQIGDYDEVNQKIMEEKDE